MMRPLVQSSRVRLELVNYCQYNHIFVKDTTVWAPTTVGWTSKGPNGTGLCRAAKGYCNNKTGYIHPDTHRWGHRKVIARGHIRSVKGSVLTLPRTSCRTGYQHGCCRRFWLHSRAEV